MTDRFAETPSFDEYVAARGGDLLRTAWLLVGDDRRAEALVRTTLARTWPQWHHLSEVGAGSYDAQLRRALMATYLRRPLFGRDADGDGRRDRHATSAGEKPRAVGRSPSAAPSRAEVLDALAALSRRDRATLVLWGLDGLREPQIAEALDDDLPAVHRSHRHALEVVGGLLGLDDEDLRAVLATLPPQDPSTEGLVDAPSRYAARRRGARGWALTAVAVVGVGMVGALATRDGDGGVVPQPTTSGPAPLSCGASFGPPSPPVGPTGPLSRTVAAVLVCAQTDEGSVWAGSLPPDTLVTVPLAIDALSLQPRTKGTGCADLPQGPAFRMLLRGIDGSTRTYANEGLACNGWPALASYYVAVAEQGASTAPSSSDGFLGCPSILGKTASRTGVVSPRLPRGTVLAAATACLHPRPILNAVPRYRAVRANVMGGPQLAQLNKDLARAGSARVSGSTCATGTSLFVVRARTDQGRLLELSSSCADRFTVDWRARDSWPVSAQTRDMLRALLVVAD